MKGLNISFVKSKNMSRIWSNLIGVTQINSDKKFFICYIREQQDWLFSSIFILTLQKASLTCVEFACSTSVGFVHPVLIVYSLRCDVILPSQFPWQYLFFQFLTEFQFFTEWKLRRSRLISRHKAESHASACISALKQLLFRCCLHEIFF